MKKLKESSHIIQIIEVYESTEEVIIVMEFIGGGNLGSFNFSIENYARESEVKFMVCQILIASYAMKKQGIIHRDLKPDNILISN